MKKRWIEDAAISGLKLTLRDVARVTPQPTRGVKVVTIRHAWPETRHDARVWAGIVDAIKRGARELMQADARIDTVQVWSHNKCWIVNEICRDDVGLA